MDSLYDLAEGIRKCTACPLWKGRLLAVPGEGPINPRMMIVGEAPGAEEDRQGIPFVGRSGKFLTQMLSEIGIDRKDVFITGSVKCHPLQNRTPKSLELSTCKTLWLDKQVQVIEPELIVILGGVALKSLLGEQSVNEYHGKVIVRDRNHYFVTYHPSAALRFPTIKLKMSKDFEKLGNLMKIKNKKTRSD